MKTKNKLISTTLKFALAAMVFTLLQTPAWSAEQSTCKTCHLDEDKLTATLKVDKTVKSAMQSGSG